MKWSARAVAFAAATLFVAACGGKIVDPTYPGEPLATLQGQLTVPGGTTVGAVHLAVAWYKDSTNPTKPADIVTEDVTYQGTFPANYTFNLYNPPPASALNPNPTGAGNIAYGVLIAYEDTNGNGKLDAIPLGGPVADKVLGASASFFDVGRTGYWVYYADTDVPSSWPAGAQKGFNLVRYEGTETVAPFTTPVPIDLTAENELNALLCIADYLGGDPTDPNPLGFCQLPATPSVLRVSASFRRTVTETAGATSTRDSVFVTLTDGVHALPGATVQANGKALTDDGEGNYTSDFGAVGVLLPGATNTVSVAAPGFAPVTVQVEVPAEARLTAPALGAQVKSGSSVTYAWNAAPLTQRYRASLFKGESAELLWSATQKELAGATSVTTAPVTYTGPARAWLSARGKIVSDRYGSFSSASVTHTRDIELIP